MHRIRAKLPLVGLAAAGTAGVYIADSSFESSKRNAIRSQKVVIIGGGVMGGASAWALAEHRTVTLLDAGLPGSSWGETRISRLAYSDPLYIRLMRRGFELWDKLAAETGRQLLKPVPCLDIGEIDVPSLRDLISTYDSLNMEYEELSATQVHERYPQIRLATSERGVLQQDAGALLAAECVAALEEAAVAKGAEWLSGQAMIAIDRKKKQVTTASGKVLEYDRLVICAGPWTNSVLDSAGLPRLPLVVSNEQNVYYEPAEGYQGPDHTADAAMPLILNHMPKQGQDVKHCGFYVIPNVGGVPGVKLGFHRGGPLLRTDEFPTRDDVAEGLHVLPNPDKVFKSERTDEVDPRPKALCDDFVAKHLPGLDVKTAHHIRCMYTLHTLPDEYFLVGPHPSDIDVIVVCGFGGEGFKFGAAIGELVSELLREKKPTVAEAKRYFRLDRAFL